MLIVIPGGGLGNRLMAMASAKVLAEHIGCGFEVSWNPQEYLPYTDCSLARLFEGLESVPAPNESSPGVVYFDHHSPEPRPEVEERLRAGDTVCLRSYCFIQPQGMSHGDFMARIHRQFDLLKPVSELQARIPQLPPGTIGIQIRNGDNWHATQFSPLSLFFQVMDRHCRDKPDSAFYLTTDSPRVLRLVHKRYGSRVFSASPGEWSKENGALARHGLVKLYTMARTSRIYRSHMTSYSFISHLIGRQPIICVALPNRSTGWYSDPGVNLHYRMLFWDFQTGSWRKYDSPGVPVGRRLQAEWARWRARFFLSKAFQLWPLHRLGPLD